MTHKQKNRSETKTFIEAQKAVMWVSYMQHNGQIKQNKYIWYKYRKKC